MLYYNPMKKSITLFLTALLASGFAAAATVPTNVTAKADAGIIGPGHPFYFLENTVVDPTQKAIGLKSAADIAQEKAAEALQAAEKGNAAAVERAVNQFNQSMNLVDEAKNSQGLQGSVEVLRQVRNSTPDQADPGLSTALDNILENTQRMLSGTGGALPGGGAQGDSNSQNPGTPN